MRFGIELKISLTHCNGKISDYPVFEIRLADYPANDIFLLSAISVKPVYPVSHNSRFSLPGR